jgi:hypothetical protein
MGDIPKLVLKKKENKGRKHRPELTIKDGCIF